MRHLPALSLLLVLALPNVALADQDGPRRVSATSPLAGSCAANDRTVLYGEEVDIEEELAVAINPRRASNTVVAWSQDLGRGIVVASTHNGGRTWQRTVVPGLSACTGGAYDRVIHPRLSFGPDGALYLLTSPLDGFFPDPRSVVADLAVSTSRDGGRTWSAPRIVNSAPVLNDLGGLAAEPNTPGGAVVAWSRTEGVLDALVVSRTTDHGRTWTTTDVRAPSVANIAGKVVVAHPDGSLLVFVREEPLDTFLGLPLSQRPISVIRSTDKGATWHEAVEIVADSDAYFWPLAAVSPDGSTHLVWGTATEDGLLRLHLRTSRDAGLTWGEAQEVTSVDRFDNVVMAPVLVAGEDGALALAHYARSDDGLSVMLTRSADDGTTWTTQRLAGPFAEGAVEHWALGPLPVSYQLGLAAGRGSKLSAAFIATGDLAVEGVSDVYVGAVPR